MIYRPVVDQFPVIPALDPWSAAVFAAAFLGALALTVRRPAYGACALIAVMPFALYREVFSTAMTLPRPVLLGVLVGLTTYRGAFAVLRSRPMFWIGGALLAYTCATALSGIGAAHLDLVLRETFKDLEYLLVLVAAYVCYRLDPDADCTLGALAGVTVAVSLSALAQEVIGAPSGLYVGNAIVPRIAGVLEGPNQLAGYYDLAIPALGAWAVTKRTTLAAAALALATAADVLTFSRSGLLAVGAAAVLLVVVYGRPMLVALRPAYAGFAAGVAVIAGWGIYVHSANVFRMSIESAYAGGVGNRKELWAAAIRMFLRHPLTGVGAGNYELELPFYGVLGVRTHANSWYLQSLAEGGILLFGATLAMLAAFAVTFARAVRRSPWISGALAGALALALHQIADYLVFFPKIGGTWWVLAGIACAALP
ncbi:MAG: O-antigen ligase family protein [Candidatus Eremiobacteraeota bacterium]|nr:O-antigen ligase family protein [Candidatus Eremiobacteraeota bacterium]MBV8435115.1 O-antigen ligase family protein [Candidatus Eremiobacteraeota bacterium]